MKKKILLILVIIIVLVLIVFLAVRSSFSFKLIGDNNVNVAVDSNYEELGYEAKYLGTDISKEVKIESNIDTNKIGQYEVTYTIDKLFVNRKLIRTVVVEDLEKPVISLTGDSNIIIYKNEEYKEPGYKATDNYDGDITENVEIENNLDNSKAGNYTITYKVKDSSNNEFIITRNIEVKEKNIVSSNNEIEPTYINGILIVNKKYGLPSSFGGNNKEAQSALEKLQSAAKLDGYSMPLVSGYRSYNTQKSIYNSYVQRWGKEYTDTVSAQPGHSEHQTGLAFDVGELNSNYGNTKEGIWLKENCHKYGFIIRYLKGKEDITGYSYEPWHIRYVGVEIATKIMSQNITLEEYLGIA